MNTKTQKGGRLDGGAAEEQALLSSPEVFAPNRAGRTRGLQQYYTPGEVARWVASVVGRGHTVVDVAGAGNGALLAAFPEECRYGVEVDGDQLRHAARLKQPFTAIHGDSQRVYPLLVNLGASFDVAFSNPAFGLSWNVPGLGEGSSTAMAAQMMRGLLRPGGMGVLICGRDRFAREVRELPSLVPGRGSIGQHLVAIVSVEKLFPGVKLPTSIVFWREEGLQEEAPPPLEVELATMAGLTEELAEKVREANRSRFSWWNYYSIGRSHSYGFTGTVSLGEVFAATQAEYERRTAERLSGPAFSLSLKGQRIHVQVSGYTRLALVQAGHRSAIEWLQSFHRQALAYFALQNREWLKLKALANESSLALTLEPALVAAVEAAIEEGRRAAIPLYPVAPAQRLGFLTDMDTIQCVQSDPEKGFVAGTSYRIECSTAVIKNKELRDRPTVKEGVEVLVPTEYLVERKGMSIQIGEQKFNEDQADLTYILAHFEVPDPGDLERHFPAMVAFWRGILRKVEAEIQGFKPGFRFRSFQVEDLVRLLIKGGGILAWEMGLGKAIGQMAYIRALELAGRVPDECALFIMPADLIQQFSEECARFFGRSFVVVKDRSTAWAARHMVEARRADLKAQRSGAHLAPRPGVWAISWFEALSRTGRIDEEAAPRIARWRLSREAPTPAHWYRNEYFEETPGKQVRMKVLSTMACPACGTDADGGWNGRVCKAKVKVPREDGTVRVRTCGHVEKGLQVKAAYSIIANTFRTVTVDEGTQIQGDDSLRSKAIRAIRARHRLLATGTPIKNFVVSLFWLLWWALRDSSARFPYAYKGGMDRFVEDFAVIETRLDEDGKKEGRPRIQPEVTNLMRLWKMLCSSVVRRRMDEVGVVISEAGEWTCKGCGKGHTAQVVQPDGRWRKPATLECSCGMVADAIVPLKFVIVSAPLGMAQQKYTAAWLQKRNFVSHFKRKFPQHPMCLAKNGDALISLNAACLGQLIKLGYAAIDPAGDPDSDYKPEGLSAWTPARMEVLKIAEREAKAGRRVLIGSRLVGVGSWLSARLQERGVRAFHITEADASGKCRTLSPAKRAKLLGEFRAGKQDVACVSAQAVALGHNLDCASVFIGYGLPWDFAGFEQLLKRVRRLSSMEPVTAYIVIPDQSLEAKIWEQLQDKTMASELALDGKWSPRREQAVDKTAILRQMQEEGVTVTGEEVPEAMLEAAWRGEG